MDTAREIDCQERSWKFTGWLWASNILLGLLYLKFAHANLQFLMTTIKPSVVISLVFCTLSGIIFLVRRAPKSASKIPSEWFCAVAGTYAILLFRPVPGTHDLLILQVLQISGVLLSMTGLMSLGRSFGIVPANRGIKTGGLYRFVRHPMYTGYLLSNLCFVLQNPSINNCYILALFVLLKFLRITMEEGHLSEDASYREMKERVKYRIIPFVW